MFAKLKKKLEEEVHTDLSKTLHSPSATPSPSSRRSAGNSRQSSPTRERRASVSSTDSRESYRPNNATENVEDVLNQLKSKSEHVKRLETRLQEYYCSLQEQLDIKAKLEKELEAQKCLSTSSLKKLEEEFNEKLHSLESEKAEVVKKYDSVRRLYNSFLEKQQAIDELEGFQTQEMAKIKHLLLNCQEELQTKEEKMSTLNSQLDDARSKMETLETENKTLKEKFKDDETDRLRLDEISGSRLAQIQKLQEAQTSLSGQNSKLQRELEESNKKNSRFEQLLGELRDENDSLAHTHEVYVETAEKTTEEKLSLISHLEERISILEQRLADSNLNGDEQYKAILVERDNLEKKLEESRQHLLGIKSNWSEKILNLEKQISHLNKKIVEDNQEIERLERSAESNGKAASEEISQLNRQLLSLKSEIDDLKKTSQQREEGLIVEISRLKKEILDIRAAKSIGEAHSATEISKLNNNIIALEQDLAMERRRFEEAVVEFKTKEAETKQELLKRRKQIEHLQTDLNEKIELIEKQNEKEKELEKKDSESLVEKANLNEICEDLRNQLMKMEEKFGQLTEDYEVEKRFHCEASAALQECQKEREELASKMKDDAASLDVTQKELDRLKQSLSENEELVKGNTEKSVEAVKLKAMISQLENELLERNKTIKLQQQRINDMKKALQRELKVQGSGASSSNLDFSNGDSAISNLSGKNLLSAANVTQKDVIPADFEQKLQTVDFDTPSCEDINFRYLKHVILKFMTSREYEAQHLIKAVSVLLHFTPDEERLIRDTLDWKMSWFGSKPKYGSGQMSKTIPTS